MWLKTAGFYSGCQLVAFACERARHFARKEDAKKCDEDGGLRSLVAVESERHINQNDRGSECCLNHDDFTTLKMLRHTNCLTNFAEKSCAQLKLGFSLISR